MTKGIFILSALLVGLTACKKEEASTPPEDTGSAAAPDPAPVDEPAADKTDEPKEEPPKEEAKPAAGDVLAVVGASKAKTFTELLAASEFSAQLHSADGAGFTLLAPTDEAFAKLPKGTLEKLKKNKDELERVLKFHIVTGTNDVNKLTNFRTAPTALGKELEVKVVQDTEVTIQGAKLVETDLPASNGFVHIIDKVLLPKK